MAIANTKKTPYCLEDFSKFLEISIVA